MLRAALEVRPYTVRKGDTLASIAEKRGLELKSLQKLHHEESNLNNLAEGQKILLPAGKLSARDKDIISGARARLVTAGGRRAAHQERPAIARRHRWCTRAQASGRAPTAPSLCARERSWPTSWRHADSRGAPAARRRPSLT